MYPDFLGTFLLVFFLGIWIPFVRSKTDSQHVAALNVMYTSLNSPSKLDGWKASGGDPCGESWDGITCTDSKVTEIDVSKNKLKQEIPYQLPPNAVYIDLSKNQFTGNVPFSVSLMSDLEHLDVSNNKLNGQLTDMFQKLPKLKIMFLQNNKFTGKITMLGNLPLDELNVANNKFTGWIPAKLVDINNLVTDGNNWSKGPAPPGQKAAANAKGGGGGGPKVSTAVMISLIVLGVVVIMVLLIIVFFSRKKSTSSSPSSFLDDEEKMSRKAVTPLASQELSRDPYSHFHRNPRESFESAASVDVKKLQKAPPPADFAQSLNDNEFATRLNSKRDPAAAKAICYSLSDLQSATGDFAPGRLLGEGSLGRVYRAKYPDGKVLKFRVSIFTQLSLCQVSFHMRHLHEACSPSVIHKNIKSSNILLDLDLNPHLCDYGFANFHTIVTTNSLFFRYRISKFNRSKPKPEQALVRWASPQLHDIEALEKMVDPALRGLYPPKSISRFADIVALCVQVEPEFRPPMSEVVQSLVTLVQHSNMNMKDDLTASRHAEDLDF
ncbi:Protein STRUBBELIG-RECEPTOR FAMILY 7 [Linum grandiflorum]